MWRLKSIMIDSLRYSIVSLFIENSGIMTGTSAYPGNEQELCTSQAQAENESLLDQSQLGLEPTTFPLLVWSMLYKSNCLLVWYGSLLGEAFPLTIIHPSAQFSIQCITVPYNGKYAIHWVSSAFCVWSRNLKVRISSEMPHKWRTLLSVVEPEISLVPRRLLDSCVTQHTRTFMPCGLVPLEMSWWLQQHVKNAVWVSCRMSWSLKEWGLL